ncbi:Protein CBG15093 [Caenorhabditis briggsae]|uniref:Protein CBG15093 n=1 Tax=Caenorhabditis briggsae TaxID=6238 RepID=A8XLD4_CAEBR|nr:Protein CBG15093 [Caenorhabditis briggsae]CAP33459.1 Protein CBG15093 [Caenorhabditis briggsae]
MQHNFFTFNEESSANLTRAERHQQFVQYLQASSYMANGPVSTTGFEIVRLTHTHTDSLVNFTRFLFSHFLCLLP